MITGQLQKHELLPLAAEVEKAVPPLDYEAILSEIKQSLQNILNDNKTLRSVNLELLPESDSILKILEVLAYREFLTRQRMNEALKACYLATARNEDLRRLAELIIPERAYEHAFDDKCREAVINEYQNIHTAGSRRAYITLAHQAAGDNETLREVHVVSTRKGQVDVSLLYQPHVTGSAKELAFERVTKTLQDDAIRPIGQKVVINDARVVPYQVKATLGFRDRLGSVEAIAAAKNAVLAFIEEKYRFGQNIYHNAVLSALHQPGVDYIILQPLKEHRALSDVASGSNQAPWCHPDNVHIQLHSDVPSEKIKGIRIEKIQRKRQLMSCELVIEPPQHEIRLTYYTLYWGDEDGEKLPGVSAIQSLPVGGERRVRLVNETVPQTAKTFVVFTVNENGEMGTVSGDAGAQEDDQRAGYAINIPSTEMNGS